MAMNLLGRTKHFTTVGLTLMSNSYFNESMVRIGVLLLVLSGIS